MCGIAGILSLRGDSLPPERVLPMIHALAHRGPDGEGSWAEGPVCFGHRRLAVRDLSDAARQPMQDPSGRVTVTYNGEIYNYEELRREIERKTGHQFRTASDTELLPAGYLAWGDHVFDRLDGIFAIGLWDRAAQRLVLARDGIGIKPLYVHTGDGIIHFASEVKGLLADPTVPRRIALPGLLRFLAQGYVGPSTSLLEGIGQVPPGTVRIIDKGGIRDRCFWQPKRGPVVKRLDQAVDAFPALFQSVVESELVSDVPVGLLQSGGIDSSLIAFSLRGRNLPSFTAAFLEPSHDESKLAGQAATAAGHQINFVGLEKQPTLVEDFKAVALQFDGQVADSSGLALFALSREIRKFVTVVLSGDGADEFFGGYSTYRATRLASVLSRVVPGRVARAIGHGLLAVGARDESRLPSRELIGRFLMGLAIKRGHHAEWRRLAQRDVLLEVCGPSLRELAAYDELSDYRDALDSNEGKLIDRSLVADQRYYLPADMLMKVDAMSMAHALEVRVPFLNRRIVEFASQLDASLLCPMKGPDKLVLRRALRKMGGPPGVVRAPKRGFNVPVASLLRGPLRSLAEDHLETGIGLPRAIEAGGVRRIWRAHRDRSRSYGYLLWALLSLAIWGKSIGLQ